MACRVALSLAAFILVSALTASAQPGAAAIKPPANDDCLACHDDVGKPFAASIHAAASCVDCHADLSTVQEFPHSETVAKVSCATCHGDIASQYHDGIHAWAKEKAGLKMAPSCADCHGTHDISPKASAASRTHTNNVPATCGRCHEGVADRYNQSIHAYWEKFDYWAVLWGTAIMGAAGLILWFPEAAAFLPGWMFNVALFVHGAEATLAIGFIFVVHFFNGHLRPNKFPMDLVIFTGSVSEEELRHERAGEYTRLEQNGQLSALTVPAPGDAERRRAYVVGTIGLMTGLMLFVLILQAVL